MTSEEIKADINESDRSARWLREIAYQLALMNESYVSGKNNVWIALDVLRKQVHDLTDTLAHAEPGKKDTEATPANIPIGWRCGSCNYGRDFSDGNLRARAKKDLEYGWCPACDNKGLQLVFERQFFTPDREPSNDPTGDILAGEIFRRQHEPKGPKA